MTEPRSRPGQDEWREAIRIAAAFLRKNFRMNADDANDLASDAAVKAVNSWRAEASFSTFVTEIARRDAARVASRKARSRDAESALRRQLQAGADIMGRGLERLATGQSSRLKPTASQRRSLAPVLRAFFRHQNASLQLSMAPVDVAEFLESQIRYYLPQLFRDHGVPDRDRPALFHGHPVSDEDGGDRFTNDPVVAAYVARVAARVERTWQLGNTGGWVESLDTLDERPRVAGRPRRDPYLSGDRGVEIQAVFQEQRRRLAHMTFKKKREDAKHAVVLYALACAGIPSSFVNAIMKDDRSATARREKQRQARGVKALQKLEKKSAR